MKGFKGDSNLPEIAGALWSAVLKGGLWSICMASSPHLCNSSCWKCRPESTARCASVRKCSGTKELSRSAYALEINLRLGNLSPIRCLSTVT